MSATSTLEEAARFLALSPEARRREAKTGVILEAKAGKCWCSKEPDFVDNLDSRDACALVGARR